MKSNLETSPTHSTACPLSSVGKNVQILRRHNNFDINVIVPENASQLCDNTCHKR